MKFLGTLFIILFILWILGKILSRFWPSIAIWLLKRQMRRQMDQAFGPGAFRQDDGSDNFDPFADLRRRQQQAQRNSRRSSKKIDPSVGEYVEFEEVRCHVEQTSEAPRPFKPEPQIEDADWEEIK